MASVTLEHLTKTYPNGFVSVNDINLHIEDGEFVIFHGPSGWAMICSTISFPATGALQWLFRITPCTAILMHMIIWRSVCGSEISRGL